MKSLNGAVEVVGRIGVLVVHGGVERSENGRPSLREAPDLADASLASNPFSLAPCLALPEGWVWIRKKLGRMILFANND